MVQTAETVVAISQIMLAAGTPIPDDEPSPAPSSKGYRAEPKKVAPQ